MKKKKDDVKELEKQEVVIEDETGSCRLVLWEDVSYRLGDVGMHKFGVSKYLSYTKASTKESVDNLEVNDDEVGWEETEHSGRVSGRVASGEISAVISVAEYRCKLCHSKVEIKDAFARLVNLSGLWGVHTSESIRQHSYPHTIPYPSPMPLYNSLAKGNQTHVGHHSAWLSIKGLERNHV